MFVEDGPPVFPLDTPSFEITDDDNLFIFRATLTLVNKQPSGVTDQLLGTSNADFTVNGNGSRQLIIDAVSRFTTRHTELIAFLGTVAFTTDDQAPYVTRNLSIVVEELPVGEAPSAPFYLPIAVTPVNDRPVYSRSDSAVSMAVLDDYLPQDTNNRGFNASFLISYSEVVDIDRVSPVSNDFIGLALTLATAPVYLGAWQYWMEGAWLPVPDNITSCSPLLLQSDQRLRFSPVPNLGKMDGQAYIAFRVWDGSSDNVGGACVNGSLQVAQGQCTIRNYS